MNTSNRCTPHARSGVVALLAAFFILVPEVAGADQSIDGDSSQSDAKLETVVSATRTWVPASHVGSSVTVISAEELKLNQYEWVYDALRQVPGVDVVRSGSYGAITSVFIRGANSNHTLALVDGVEIADPSTPTGAVDFSDLPPDNIERIEVLRGAASSLYGSDAIGGVINIITREGSGPSRFSLLGEGGSYQTVHGLASALGGTPWVNYSLSASAIRSDGISSSPLQTRPYLRSNLSAKLSTSFFETWKLSLVTRYLNSRTNIDDTDFNGHAVFVPNYIQRIDQVLMRPELRGSLFDGRWLQTLGFSWAHTSRVLDKLPDAVNPSSSKFRFLGVKTKVDWQHQVKLFSGNEALLLLERKEEIAETSSASSIFGYNAFPRSSTRTYAVTFEDRQQLFDSLYLTASGRWDHHSLFGDVGTESVAISYEIAPTGTRFHATEGTGFHAPSLLQLYDPRFGNRDLRPERSWSVDAGIDQSFFDRVLTVGSTFFITEIKNVIGFAPVTFRSINLKSAHITGVENFAAISYRGFYARADYTWMHPVDQSACGADFFEPPGTCRDLVRRPRHKVEAQAHQSIAGLTLGARLTYVGDRDDVDFASSPPRITLGDYFLVAITAEYQLTRNISLFGRVENVFNARYEEVHTFPVPSRTWFLGARADI